MLFRLCDQITECCVRQNSQFVLRDIQNIQIHCGQNVEFMNFTTGGIQSKREALKD